MFLNVISKSNKNMEQEVIDEVMTKYGVTTDQIPLERGVDPTKLEAINQSRRYFKTKAFASFSGHGSCLRSWKSAHAWCVLDLRTQCIAHKLSQDCQSCNGRSMPHFDRDSMERMAEFAVDLYLKRSGKKVWQPRNDPFRFDDWLENLDSRPPHDEARCEMCRKLGRSCWK